ncbi:DUF6000 family protein [Streptomyces griseoluteus]
MEPTATATDALPHRPAGDNWRARNRRSHRTPDLAYDQTVVMGALQFIVLKLGGGRADRFRGPGGLWQQWLTDAPHMRGDSDPALSHLSLVRGLCAFVEECAEAR